MGWFMKFFFILFLFCSFDSNAGNCVDPLFFSTPIENDSLQSEKSVSSGIDKKEQEDFEGAKKRFYKSHSTSDI